MPLLEVGNLQTYFPHARRAGPREQIVVGVNRLQLEAEPPVNVLRIKSLRYPAEDGEYENARMNKLGL